MHTPTGRQFLIAEDILFTGSYPSYGDSLDAGIQCFLLAIEVGGDGEPVMVCTGAVGSGSLQTWQPGDGCNVLSRDCTQTQGKTASF